MKKQSFILVLCAILSLSLASCSKETIIGGGDVVTETRAISAKFTAIRLQSTANVLIKQGSPASVDIKTFGNVVPAVTTTVSGNILVIDTEGSVTNAATEITITVPNLTEITASGTGNIGTIGNYIFNDLIVAVNGTGTIKLAGVCKNLMTRNTGTGGIDVFDMPAQTVHATSSGTGELKTTVNQTLNANISGSGNIIYKGDPTVIRRITGSGEVKKY